MDKKKDRCAGLLSLEASIALTLFIFLMLFMYSFFVIFEARNQIGHVLLTTADSLSMDALAADNVTDSSIQGIITKIYGNNLKSNGTFTETGKWYDEPALTQEVIKARFLAYFSGGDKALAEDMLKKLNIDNGFEGLDFTESKVSGDELVLKVTYKVVPGFNGIGMKDMEFSQSCCSKLWK